ncbi:unnamed protein product [Spirodela intermedia]|uniref:Uncharacterized protein n=1 Tax=Spirodela intermedia TaxID=51605 RepID=A0A7I8I985_SPIIN|nr:unnamed protein product [Spirodela intermedia]CAA6654237.1 unnamed protein product [Spirodela intermedia]
MAALAQLTFPRLRTCCSTASQARSASGDNRGKTPPGRRKPSRGVKAEPRIVSDHPPEAPSHRLSSAGGGEATTYTRLPPKDDFLLPSFANPARMEVTSEIKLRIFSERWAGDETGDEEEEEDFEENIFQGLAQLEFGGDERGLLASIGRDEELDVFEGEGEGEGEEKEKGIPAVMRCFDRAKIYVKAGDGGNGVVAFRREKFVPYGGPSGGDGGRGGNVYIEVDGSMNSLLPFRKNVHFRAGRGAHGQGRKQAGAKGEDMVVMVAPGTVIRESRKGGIEGEVLLELMHPGQRALLLPGGRGGRGNASFKTGTQRVPKIAENGEEGAEIGCTKCWEKHSSERNKCCSANHSKLPLHNITTKSGVVSLDYDATMVVADLPGLLEGAHRGFGLGHEFLRHTERCSVLVHVVDGSGEQPLYEFDAVRLELELFSPELAEKPYLVAFNKMDLPEAYDQWDSFKQCLEDRGINPFCISAANRHGTQDVVSSMYQLLQSEWNAEKEAQDWTAPLNLNHVAETIQKQRSASMSEFEIYRDNNSSTWFVVGAGIQRFVQMTNWQYSESLRRFQHALEACGVNKTLIKKGVKEGDTVVVGEMEMIWHDSPKAFGLSKQKKTVAEE